MGAVYQQSRRWLDAGCFEAMESDLRSIIRVAQGCPNQLSVVVMDGRTLQSSCESGPRAGNDGYKRKHGSKVIWQWTRGPSAWSVCDASRRTRAGTSADAVQAIAAGH